MKNTENDKWNILYVDDEARNLVALKANLRKSYNVITAGSAAEGLKILRSKKIHVIITDQRMPEMTGVEFLESVLEEFPDTIRIILTGYTDIGALMGAINKCQVYRYITKPYNENELIEVLEKAKEIYYMRQENTELLKRLVEVNQELDSMLKRKLQV